jgi:rubrerythrin
VERAALGKTGYAVYLVMLTQQEPCKAVTLVRLSGLSQRQVYYALKKLAVYDLVTKTKTFYSATVMSDEELDEQVARPAGTLGKAEERRARYQRERAARAAKRLYEARWGKGYTPESQQIVGEQPPAYWKCEGCGQVWGLPGLEPPLTCDFCGDVTAWRVMK